MAEGRIVVKMTEIEPVKRALDEAARALTAERARADALAAQIAATERARDLLAGSLAREQVASARLREAVESEVRARYNRYVWADDEMAAYLCDMYGSDAATTPAPADAGREQRVGVNLDRVDGAAQRLMDRGFSRAFDNATWHDVEVLISAYRALRRNAPVDAREG